jgi:hypothetical protein
VVRAAHAASDLYRRNAATANKNPSQHWGTDWGQVSGLQV